jgi:hypothetical protein
MQNFVGASKLAGNTQNRPEIPKNRTKTLKTEQKQSLEARRSLAGASPETTKLAGISQTTPEISITTTTDPIDDYMTAIQHQLSCCPNKPGSPAATYFTSGSHFRHQTPQTRPAKQHDRPPKTNFFFFPPEGVPVYIKHEQKKTATERYTKVLPVWANPHGQCCRQQEKTNDRLSQNRNKLWYQVKIL